MSIDLARALVDGGVRVSVPTTLNVGSVDLLHHPRNWNGTDELADNARTLMGLYTALGCQTQDLYRVTVEELRRAWTQLCTRRGGTLAAVCVGTPHFSLTEFRTLADLIAGRRVRPATPMYVNSGRWVYNEFQNQGIAEALEASGVRIVTDTCTYIAPILGELNGLVMTNSA